MTHSRCRSNSRRSSASPLRGEREQALAAVVAAGRLDDVVLLHQRGQHPGQRLLGDAEDAEQVAHRDPRPAADEMQHPVMRPAHAQLRQDLVGAGGEVAIAEEEQVLGQAQLLLPQEQQVAAGTDRRADLLVRLRVGPLVRWFGHGWHAAPSGLLFGQQR